jgi:hypothetical protein
VKVRIVGKLYFSEEDGLQYSVSLDQRPKIRESILLYEAERSIGSLLTDPSRLAVGDFVVHADHGVACYKGVRRVNSEGKERDYLLLQYAGDQWLYVPTDRMGLVQKYTGGTPRLDRLKDQPGNRQRYWATYRLEALSNAYEWPGLGAFPDIPQAIGENAAAIEKWRNACDAYKQALHADPKYRQATVEFLERQRREPQPLLPQCWAFRDKVLGVDSTEPEGVPDRETEVLLVKHYVLRHDRSYEKIRREIEAMENLTRVEGVAREPIPESVRLFVWQRDRGQCVKCGSRERLEFDHIIPIIAGGSNTERNIQLLCETCNRSKGATV